MIDSIAKSAKKTLSKLVDSARRLPQKLQASNTRPGKKRPSRTKGVELARQALRQRFKYRIPKRIRPLRTLTYNNLPKGFCHRFWTTDLAGRHEYLLSPKQSTQPFNRISLIRAPRPEWSISKKMKIDLHFVTAPTVDTPGTTLLLHCDNKRYLFGNVSEGTQRACSQRKIPLSKLSDIFLTGSTNWQTTGGLMGTILTVADVLSNRPIEHGKSTEASSRKLMLHGDRNLTHMIATARKFIFRKGLPLRVNEIKENSRPEATEDVRAGNPTWEDENIRVWAMSTESSSSNTRKRSHQDMIGEVNGNTAPKGGSGTKEERDAMIRAGVVGHMFDSDWRLDTLKTVRLCDVQLPAKIFTRKKDGGLTEYDGPLPGGDTPVPDVNVLVRYPWPGASITSLPSTTPSTTAVSYIIKPRRQRGKFRPEKALGLGVERGSSFSLLTKGQNVTTKAGKIITPDMVMDPGREGNGFAVVEIPDNTFIDGLLDRKEWTSGVMEGVGTIVWILGDDLVQDTRILEFMAKHNALRHLVSSYECSPNRIALESPASAAIRLHQIDPECFPIPAFANDSQFLPDVNIFGRLQVGAKLQLEPKLEFSEKNVIKDLDITSIAKETSREVLELAKEARDQVNSPDHQSKIEEQQKDLPSKDTEVITLGTGSAMPSKYRNVSATLVRVPGVGNYLFDCGENTLGQIKRVFGSDWQSELQKLRVIWISHLHADHHLGTVSVIKAWNEVTKNAGLGLKKLVIASDVGMIQWLAEYSEVEDFGHERLLKFSLINETDFTVNFSASKYDDSGLTSINATRVSHCAGALAVVFNFENGLKVAYSGDCRPSENFARLGLGATLLIHEATFDDELRGDAIVKKHSTSSEALEIGRKMRARRIVLTHFSQRYQKLPVFNSDNDDQVAIVAFDYMRCRLSDFAKVAAYRPALLKLYEEDEADDDDTIQVSATIPEHDMLAYPDAAAVPNGLVM